MRKNTKKQVITDQIISKSNELSLSQLNTGLTLRQMQLLAFAIYCTQRKETTLFSKSEVEKFYGLPKYSTAEAKRDVEALMSLDVQIIDFGERGIVMFHVFSSISYLDGKFQFKWTEDMLPHILELKERFIMVDLATTINFTSSYAWRLYDFLKAKHGQWSWEVAKEDLMQMFNVQDKKAYQNTSNFKRKVLDMAVADVNKHTEYDVTYEDIKKGRKVTGFHIQWTKGQVRKGMSEKQRRELEKYIQVITQDALRVVDLPSEKQMPVMEILRKTASYRDKLNDTDHKALATHYEEYSTALKALLKQMQEYFED